MEQQSANVIYGRAGGVKSQNAYTCKIPLPKAWLDRMGVTPENVEMTLLFDDKRIVLMRAEGQPMKRVPLADKNDIRRFALVWREMYKNHASVAGYFFESIEFIGEGMSDLGFVMDCGESAEEAVPDANIFRSNEALLRNIDKLDVQTLGNAVYSQWRYWNHWAMSPMAEEDYQWFVIAFTRLAQLNE